MPFEETIVQEIDSNAAFGSLRMWEKCQRLKHNINVREVVSEEEEENRSKKDERGLFQLQISLLLIWASMYLTQKVANDWQKIWFDFEWNLISTVLLSQLLNF